MTVLRTTRRGAVVNVLGGGLVLAWFGEHGKPLLRPTRAVETSTGRLRGLRADGVSVFRGIPYGGDTALSRFQPAPPAKPWAGVRDCFVSGPLAPQPDALGPESEDCLVLNVFTPQATPERKRPVMVWLHGGGFTQGSGGYILYDGSALSRAGDVVVVSINHRLGALGYLYLGGLSDEFTDSGNVGQLDIILALQWVRENIAAFGGDPGNVTIFGESGGGQKVGVLLCMPAAQGLFHKAIMQSAPRMNMPGNDQAAATAGKVLAELGVTNSTLHLLQTVDYRSIVAAAQSFSLEPVIDGSNLPTHPFDPVAPDISSNVPLIIGTNRDEATLALSREQGIWDMTEAQARARFMSMLGDLAEDAFVLYREQCPDDPPAYLVAALITDTAFRMNAITVAERKAAQQAVPVFMYRLDWRTPVHGGVLRAPHGLDIPLVFDNVTIARAMVGPGQAPRRMAAVMSRAWIDFAWSGNPSQPGLDWPAYDIASRKTMIFATESHVVPDPDAAARVFWSSPRLV
jgi:para-nitrobenzyl esterase